MIAKNLICDICEIRALFELYIMSNIKNILIASFATAAICLTACISFGSDDSERAHKERKKST